MDTDEFYADIDDRRIPLSGIVIYDTETEIFALENPEDRSKPDGIFGHRKVDRGTACGG
jgi:hypothetical protein